MRESISNDTKFAEKLTQDIYNSFKSNHNVIKYVKATVMYSYK